LSVTVFSPGRPVIRGSGAFAERLHIKNAEGGGDLTFIPSDRDPSKR